MIKKLWEKIFTKEMLLYLIFGILTTIINIAVYQLFYQALAVPNLLANVIAWVVAVIFAYVTNNWFVFEDSFTDWERERKKIVMFLGARLFSLAVDELGMWLLVDRWEFDSMWSKIGMNVIVVIINYIFSKFCIFVKKR